MNKIDFIIPVRDRDDNRIQNCINSIDNKYINNIIIVNYGSKQPINVKHDKLKIINVSLINFPVWNKAHAINIGIRESTSEFIATIDCDIILSSDFLDFADQYIKPTSFVFSNKVRRIKKFIPNKDIYSYSYEWSKDTTWAVGGIQIYPRWWIYKYKGVDQSLNYWGGVDNYTKRLADFNELVTINIKKLIYHQEHDKQKEEHLENLTERAKAKHDREHRDVYISHAIEDNKLFNDDNWGK